MTTTQLEGFKGANRRYDRGITLPFMEQGNCYGLKGSIRTGFLLP
jgi:hypothetical protein